jgi:outer membrane protein
MRKQPTAHSEQRVGAALAAAQGGGKPRPYPCFALAILSGLLTGPVAAETIKLSAEIAAARAVEVSHLAAAASTRLAATQETVKAADAAVLPSLAASASLAQRSSVPEFGAPINGPNQPPVVLNPDITTTYGTILRLQQALYSGGAITGQREATRHDSDASAATRAQTLAEVRLSAQLAYWEAVRTAASVEVAHAQEQRAKRLLDDTQALFDAGMAVKADVLAGSERVASARLQAIVTQTVASNALAQLRSLLQLDPADRVELTDSLVGKLPPVPGPTESLQREAVEKRPELTAGAAQLAALRSREGLARAEARPSLGAVAQWEYSRPNVRYFPQRDQWKDSWSVGLLASWTLFDGGKAQADTAASQLTQRAAAQGLEELTRRILLEVENARRNIESALAAVDAAEAARAAGIERENEARERHAAGLSPMVDVLDAQTQLATAEQQRVNARAGSWIADAVLARAVGR